MNDNEKLMAEVGSLLDKLSADIEGYQINVIMTALSVLTGSIGADFFGNNKDVFMTRIMTSISQSYDQNKEASRG
jgi:hypothetical protein